MTTIGGLRAHPVGSCVGSARAAAVLARQWHPVCTPTGLVRVGGPAGAFPAGSAPKGWGGCGVSVVVAAGVGSVIAVYEIGDSGASLRINEAGRAWSSQEAEGLR